MNDDLAATRAEDFGDLHAYLDGELAPEERGRFEQRLSSDSQLQAELHRQQRAWDLLDALPRSDVGAKFTQSTVEMIALDAAADLTTAETRPRHRWMDLALLGGGVLAAALGGFLLVDALRPHADDALLNDLSVITHLDDYGRTEPGETADFFRSLNAAKVSLPEERGDDGRRP